MSLRRFARILGAGNACALVLTLATPAMADTSPEMPATMPPIPSTPAFPPPGTPDMRPMWRENATPLPVAEVDSRARDAWISECHRRMDYYYDGYRRHRHHGRDRDQRAASDYCTAYLDDYYRAYSQPGYGRPMMMQPAAVQQPNPICTEVVTERYVPVRSRYIPRRPVYRPVHDKRIRIAP